MAEKDNLVEQRDAEELYGPWMQVVNKRRCNGHIQSNLGEKGGLSKMKGAMGSRYSVLVEELGVEEGRLEPVRNDESPGLRLLGREKSLAHSAPASEAMIVTKSHGVTTDQTRSVPGNKEGLGSGSKKKARGDSSTVLISTARQSRTCEITDVASTGTLLESPRF
ncbi:hypothetical protein V6N13_007686 [Hibiscus sabdariffa]